MIPLEQMDDIEDFVRDLRESLVPSAEEAPAQPEGELTGPEHLGLARLLASRRTRPKPEATAGQIWSVDPGDALGVRSLVLLTRVGDEVFRGVLLVDRPWLASTDDVIIPADENSNRQAMVACLWRDVPLSPASLTAFVGEVSDDALRLVRALAQHQLTGGFVREAVETVPRANVAGCEHAARHLIRWRLSDGQGLSLEYYTGPRITDDGDPRLEVRALVHAATAHIPERAWAEVEAAATEEEPAVGEGTLFERLIAKLRQELGGEDFPWEVTSPETPDGGGLLGLLTAAGAVSPSLIGAAVGLAARSLGGAQADRPITLAAQLGGSTVELEVLVQPAKLIVGGVVTALADGGSVAGVRLAVMTYDRRDAQLHSAEVTSGDDGVLFDAVVTIDEAVVRCEVVVERNQDRITLGW